jgi:hypothetical protein
MFLELPIGLNSCKRPNNNEGTTGVELDIFALVDSSHSTLYEKVQVLPNLAKFLEDVAATERPQHHNTLVLVSSCPTRF